jgi:DNA-binding transcriptional LysR family regulator
VLDAFSRRHPDCDIALVEVSFADPYGPLRRGEVDVLYNWLAVDEPDLNTSAPLDHQARVLAVSRQDPLARQQP